MKSLRKIFLTGLAALTLAAACGAAPQVPPPYPTDFRAFGTLLKYNGAPADVSNFKVVFYRSQTDSYAAGYTLAFSDAAGKYDINVHDDGRLLPLFASTGEFHIGVVAKGGYGVNETAVNITASDLRKGYLDLESLNLTLKPGEGIPDPTGPAPTDPIVDSGWIRQTNITRVGNDLKLTWDYDTPQHATAVNIYVASGPGAAYEANAGKFTQLLATVASGTKTYTDTGAAYDANFRYYRIVPSTLVSGTDLLDPKNNSITVGKVQLTLPANKYVFCGVPFLEDNQLMSDLIEGQTGDGGEFLWWDGSAYHGATYAGGSWIGEDHNLRLGEGFILRAKTDLSLALTGRFGQLATPFVVNLKGNQYNLLGYPYPQVGDFETMGIAPDEGSDLLLWLVGTQAYDGATRSGTKWVGPAGINTLQLADPRYYRPKADYPWTIKTP